MTNIGPARPDADVEAVRIYEELRKRIFQGDFPPGHELNQVHISQEYGVSRTPVREALRMLQADGLAEARFKYRMTVTQVTAAEIDQIYGLWIVSQAVATEITLGRLTRADFAACRRVLNRMSRLGGEQSSQWRALHAEFHYLLNRPAGQIVCEKIEEYWHRTERARFSLEQAEPSLFGDDSADHSGLLRAYEEHDDREAHRINTSQLVRSATAAMGIIDPDYTPTCIQKALRALKIEL